MVAVGAGGGKVFGNRFVVGTVGDNDAFVSDIELERAAHGKKGKRAGPEAARVW